MTIIPHRNRQDRTEKIQTLVTCCLILSRWFS